MTSQAPQIGREKGRRVWKMTSLGTYTLASILSFLFSVVELSAQEPNLVVYGTVRDLSTRDSIPFPYVQFKDVGRDSLPIPVVTNARGRYEIVLNEESVFHIIFSSPGKVSKSVQIDTRGPNAQDWEGGYGMNIDIMLLDSLPGVDFSVLREPFGRSAWNKEGAFEWDIEYTRAMSLRQKELMQAYEKAKLSSTIPVKK